MSCNLKQETLKKFGFTRRVDHCREDIDVYIPDYVDNLVAYQVKALGLLSKLLNFWPILTPYS